MSATPVAIVTGGSLGVGYATVQAFAARGMNVVAIARDGARLEAAIAALAPADRARVVGVAADVSKEADVIASVNETLRRFSRLDILVNSAGASMTARTPLRETTSDEWRRIIDTNLTGVYLMCREALPHLAKSDDAHIFNVQSTGAYKSGPGVSLYAASKFGVRALTEALVEECRNSNIRVTSVSPGPVNTNIWSHKREPPSDEARARMLRPGDIADIFLWLIDRPRHMHISNITVTPWTGAG